MLRLSRVLLLLCAFCLPFGMYADVTLTDEEAEELDTTLDELETTLKMQDEEIVTLKLQNEELQTLSENKQKLLDEQDKEIKTLNSSLRRQNIFSILRNILIAVISCAGGLLVGILAF